MKKIFIATAMFSSIIYAENIESEDLALALDAEKIIPKEHADTKGFMPDISLILDMSYNKNKLDKEGSIVKIPAFVHEHKQPIGSDGFKVNYAELSLGASVDSYFDMQSTFHITQNSFEIEEAFVTSTALAFHLRAKIGKFKSDFGYLNNKHEHTYNFAESPLVYQAFFSAEGINEVGLQMQYVLETKSYNMLGIEVLRGSNTQSFGYEGFNIVKTSKAPSLFIAYIKNSFDIGGGTVLSGLSFAKGKRKIDYLAEANNPYAIDGDNTIYGIDMTYKKYFSPTESLTFQNEYLYRNIKGYKILAKTYKKENLEKKQGGFYSEVIYQFDKNIRTGIRYSALSQNEVFINKTKQNIAKDMKVFSAMLEYNFSEFSRFRLQYNYNASLYNADNSHNNQNEFILQFNYAIGAHGAHSF